MSIWNQHFRIVSLHLSLHEIYIKLLLWMEHTQWIQRWLDGLQKVLSINRANVDTSVQRINKQTLKKLNKNWKRELSEEAKSGGFFPFCFQKVGGAKTSMCSGCSTVSSWVLSAGPKPYFHLLHLLWLLQSSPCSLFHAPLQSWWSQTVSCYEQ